MIVETTNYWAAKGRADDVLAQRRAATALRVAMGLPSGRIFVKREGPGPDVRWECAFETEADFAADMKARGQNPEFATARTRMHSLLERFERHVEETVADRA